MPIFDFGKAFPVGSNCASYRIRKLRRDYPEAVERLQKGEFKSVAAAFL